MSDFKIGDRVRVKGSLDGWPTMVVTGVTEFNGRWYIALVYLAAGGRIKTLDFEESCLELYPSVREDASEYQVKEYLKRQGQLLPSPRKDEPRHPDLSPEYPHHTQQLYPSYGDPPYRNPNIVWCTTGVAESRSQPGDYFNPLDHEQSK